MSGVIVTSDDPGIRTGGMPDACFYCRARVGEDHDAECVILVRSTVYALKLDGEPCGTLTMDQPAAWDDHACDYYLNDGSYCASNVLDEAGLDITSEARAELESHASECLCDRLSFRVTYRAAEIRRGAL